eukprot:m51a1_g5574 putative serine-threonine protein (634) ;mRNA; r:610301-614671
MCARTPALVLSVAACAACVLSLSVPDQPLSPCSGSVFGTADSDAASFDTSLRATTGTSYTTQVTLFQGASASYALDGVECAICDSGRSDGVVCLGRGHASVAGPVAGGVVGGAAVVVACVVAAVVVVRKRNHDKEARLETELGMARASNTATNFELTKSESFPSPTGTMCVTAFEAERTLPRLESTSDNNPLFLADSTLAVSDEDWSVAPSVLNFGLDGLQADVGVPLTQEVVITNKLSKKISFKLHPVINNKYEVNAEYPEGTIKAGSHETIDVAAILYCTAKVSTKVALAIGFFEGANVCKQHRFLKVSLEGKLSTRIDFDELQLGEAVGEGSFGTVYRGKWRGNTVAIKELKSHLIKFNSDVKSDFFREIENMEQLKSPHIVQFYGAVITPEHLCLVTEFFELGSLGSLMKHNTLLVAFRMKAALDCARGMSFLHVSNMLHRDLKPDNILVTKGLGTPLYMAPEILKGSSNYSKAADVYSFSIMLWELCTEREAFAGHGFKSLFLLTKYIVEGHRPPIPSGCPAVLASMLASCWDPSPDKRMTFEEVARELEQLVATLPGANPGEPTAVPRSTHNSWESCCKDKDEQLRPVARALAEGLSPNAAKRRKSWFQKPVVVRKDSDSSEKAPVL